MPVLMDALGLSVSGGGLLMSVFAITGLVLALPSGMIYQKAGARITGLIAGGSIVLGAILGALSPSAGTLLASRVIEGVGTTFMAVLAPGIIAHSFTGRRRGTAMGVWAAWVPVGTTAMSVVAPALVIQSGWRAVWWLGAGYALVATVLYLAVLRPAPAEVTSSEQGKAPKPVASGQILRNGSLWLLAGSFAAFSGGFVGLSTYLPTFLTSQRGLPLAQAALLASIPGLITILSAPAGGVISDRIGSRKKPYLWGFALSAILLPASGAVGAPWLVAVLIAQGLVTGLIPTNVFAAAVSLGGRRQGGLAMAAIMVGRSVGTLVGPILVGLLIETGGWTAAFVSLSATAVLGLLAGAWAKVR
jgi:nitrate/nitrite transporter NarK